MPDLDQTIEQLRRIRARPEAADRDWYRVNAKGKGKGKAEIHIYDDIGWMGTSAKSLASDIKALDVDEIELHVNSPGGDAWDGIAIYNTLRDHRASVTVVVDGVAASAASIIAMAGDTVRMNRGSQLMIHDAWGLVIGNAGDLNDAAVMFDKISNGMAEIYAARAGGTIADWREAMAAESWYSAAEAVDAGLADELIEQDGSKANARWNMTAFAFAHAGRSAAPAPRIRARPAASTEAATESSPLGADHPSDRKGALGMPDAAKLREAVGLPAEASDDEVRAALASSGLVATQTEPPKPAPNTIPDPAATPEPAKVAATATPGVMTIAASVWDETQQTIKRLAAHVDQTKRAERDTIIASAVSDGKFTPAQKPHFAKLWDADPDGTRALIENLTPNTALSIAASGYADLDDQDLEREFANLAPPGFFAKGA